MELRHLRYFVAVAENQSFRRAADRLHLTRPALSKQIRELEEEIGVRLLDRTPARVVLTSAGAVYLDEARAILARTEMAGSLARAAAAGKRGELIVGEPGVLGLKFLTPVLTSFRESFPHVEVTLREIPPSNHAAAVEAGEIQVGFAVGDAQLNRAALDHISVVRLRVGVAVAQDHPFARRALVTAADLAGQRFICISEGGSLEHAQYVRDRLTSLDVPGVRIRNVAGLRSLLTMIASGHGISLLPDTIASSAEGDVVVVPLQGDSGLFEFEMFAVWRKRDDSRIVRNFVRGLRSFAQRSPSPAGGRQPVSAG